MILCRNLFLFVFRLNCRHIRCLVAQLPHTMHTQTPTTRPFRRNALHSLESVRALLSFFILIKIKTDICEIPFFLKCFFLSLSLYTGTPGILNSPPPSPSCSHPNGNGDVFFPRGSSSSGSGSSSSSVQPSTPSSIRTHDDYRSAQWSPRGSNSGPRRR